MPSQSCMPQLCQSGWNQNGTFEQCLERPEKLIAHAVLPFLVRETLYGWEVSSLCWLKPAYGMEWWRQSEAVFLLFLCNYSQDLCSTVSLKLLKWTLEDSQSCFFFFFLWIAVQLFIFVGKGETGFSYMATFSVSTIFLLIHVSKRVWVCVFLSSLSCSISLFLSGPISVPYWK